ncbi:MAG: rod shape-determining protein RodA [Clostridia bacterium]|nr:rod shape-determining protein RodA [Clostridia bacterium]
MKKRMLKNIEWTILISVILLLIIGLVALFSATKNTNYDEFKKQLIWIAVSIPVFIFSIMVDYQRIIKYSYVVYVILLGLLVAVLFTPSINGATSWFDLGMFSFQPAELMKIFAIIVVSSVIVNIQRHGGNDQISKPLKLLFVLLFVAIPIFLILKQPDYGTAGAFLVATIFILFSSGIKKRYIVIAIILTVIILPILYYFVIPEHAKTRIDVFFNPELDPRGAGYNSMQSKLAIGAGQFLGMGLLKGNQTQLGFLYPKTTDFIFAVICEEMGFIVGTIVICLYVALITKGIYVAKTAKDDLGSYIAIGITGIFVFHVLENIGMTMGILPITGVPLPFVSYGGSSLITNFILIGLLLNISARRKKVIFVE